MSPPDPIVGAQDKILFIAAILRKVMSLGVDNGQEPIVVICRSTAVVVGELESQLLSVRNLHDIGLSTEEGRRVVGGANRGGRERDTRFGHREPQKRAWMRQWQRTGTTEVGLYSYAKNS